MMELVIDYPNNLVQAFINDAIGAAVSADLGAFSIGPTSNGIYPFGGLFTTSGSDASASAQCYFSNFEFEISNYKTG